MIWFVSKCPKCKYAEVVIDVERTLEFYQEIYDLCLDPVSMLNEDPPVMPEEFMMTCESIECGHQEKWSLQEVVGEIRNSLSSYAWAESKRNRPPNLWDLEETMIQYFQENDIEECQLERNAYLRKLYNKANDKKS